MSEQLLCASFENICPYLNDPFYVSSARGTPYEAEQFATDPKLCASIGKCGFRKTASTSAQAFEKQRFIAQEQRYHLWSERRNEEYLSDMSDEQRDNSGNY